MLSRKRAIIIADECPSSEISFNRCVMSRIVSRNKYSKKKKKSFGSPFGSKQSQRRKRKRFLEEHRRRKREEQEYKDLCLKMKAEARNKAKAERYLSSPPLGLFVFKTIRRDGLLSQGASAGLPRYEDMEKLQGDEDHNIIIVRDPTCTEVIQCSQLYTKEICF